MIELPTDLKNHIAKNVTSLAYCWTITRNDGMVFGFTDHDKTLVISGIPHDPQSGLNATAVEAELGMSISTMDVEGALRSDKISEKDLRSGKFAGASVVTTLINWSDPTQFIVLRKAKIGKIDISNGSFKAELQSLTESLDKPIGRLVRRHCDAYLGDARCKKNINSIQYQVTGSVNTLINDTDFIVSGLTAFPDQWFEEGKLEWMSGSNLGELSQISAHQAARLSLWLPLNNPVSVGDQFRITAGCDKSFAVCKSKFSNQLNFQGFPHLPGNDAVYTYVNEETVFDGAPLVH
jgi:uncharacterized phage protein (TIGR02218 family)